ncbi:hypothetical protein BGW80DRAFT_1566516 [Lactifluus volemus]|nr:hypothetical protein BGW80DRAFT_1566516 [Lactifluus volemus]
MSQLVPAIVGTFFFGLYTALFAFSTFITLRKGLSTRARYALLAISVVMYTVSLIYSILTVTTAIRTLRIGKFIINFSEVVAISYLPRINFVLSDGIVLWRAWILWDRRTKLFILQFLFLVCIGVITIVDLVFISGGFVAYSAHHQKTESTLTWAILGFIAGTNLWATSLMFIRAWQHRRFLRSVFGNENAKSKAEKTLSFLVESGAIYLCLWVAYITLQARNSSWAAVLYAGIIQLVGIYQTAIVVVITMRMSATDILSLPGGESRPYLTPIVFMPRPPTSQISKAGSNDSDTENGRETKTRQDL